MTKKLDLHVYLRINKNIFEIMAANISCQDCINDDRIFVKLEKCLYGRLITKTECQYVRCFVSKRKKMARIAQTFKNFLLSLNEVLKLIVVCKLRSL